MVKVICPHCKGSGKISLEGTTLGERVTFLRRIRGLSTREIPGVSSGQVTQIESGNTASPGGEVLAKLADGLNCSVDWLLGRDAEPPAV